MVRGGSQGLAGPHPISRSCERPCLRIRQRLVEQDTSLLLASMHLYTFDHTQKHTLESGGIEGDGERGEKEVERGEKQEEMI